MQKSRLRGLLITISIILSLNLRAQTIPEIEVANQFGVKGTLASHLEEKSLLVMGFYHCKHICHFVAKNLSQTLLTFKTYPKVVFFSIDETEGPRDAIQLRKRIVGPQRDRWSFLIADKSNIQKLVKSLNFEMSRDPVSGTITHEMGIYAIHNGVVTNKINDIVIKESDLKFEGTPNHMDAFKKFCSEFDPRKSKYGQMVVNSLTGACILFLLLAFWGFASMGRKA